MTPLDEAPEQRWRRTVERRNRPAKLNVDRLLRDFGYAELDPDVGDAIEARLAGVSLAVAPSLRHAVAGEVVTIYANANDSVALERGRGAERSGVVDPPPPEEPAGSSDIAQMVGYLKQQVLDARAEAERLRTELDRRIAARMDAERENEALIAEQAAALEAQARQLAELGAALNSSRQALAETRDEIRRAVGELQALPEPAPAEVESLLSADADEIMTDDEPRAGGVGLSGEQWADGREEAEAAARASDSVADAGPDIAADELGHGQPATPAQPREPETQLHAGTDLPEERGAAGPGDVDAADRLDAPLPPSDEWLPAALRPDGDAGSPAAEPVPIRAGEPEAGGEESSDFDDFLYDAEELDDPVEPGDAAGGDAPLESEIEARWPDQPPLESEIEAGWADESAAALPPPPAAPPSPFAEQLDPEPSAVAQRPTLGRVLRGRGGRARGRWEGTCSICGRLPQVSRRKDLEAAGWDLDDAAAACPQCRGVG